ncbi:serine/threonine-protein kinase 31-like [Heterodontus francisci]|uniref:serine/threonine-protein kinase 31-like n=1 Tax=Heterodontus francisci TaxID=7792 RepID=UPI00355AD7AC
MADGKEVNASEGIEASSSASQDEITLDKLKALSMEELRKMAEQCGITVYGKARQSELLRLVANHFSLESEEAETGKNEERQYKIKDTIIKGLQEQRDLGVYVHKSLKVAGYFEKAFNKAYAILGFINRDIEYKNKQVLDDDFTEVVEDSKRIRECKNHQDSENKMGETSLKVEDIMGSHIEDPITFWGQSIELIEVLLKMSTALTEICPFAAKVFGDPAPEKIYGGLYSEDQCWYRCKLKKLMTNEKCLMTYIDYGNSETLKKSCIVELPEDLQCPGLASKFRLWGLQIPPKQDVTPFDQGRRFLASLINDKIIRISHRDTAQDGAFLVDAESDALNIGQEVVEKGFAEKCKTASVQNYEGIKSNTALLISARNAEGFQGLSSGSQRVKNMLVSRNGQLGSKPKGQVDNVEHKNKDIKMDRENALVHALERKPSVQCRSGQKLNMIKMQHDQRLLEDQNEKLRAKNSTYLQNCHLLEGQLKQQQLELKKMEEELKQHQKVELKLADELKHAVETKLKCLANKVEKLRQLRSEFNENRFGDDLSEAVKVITEGCLCTLLSMKVLESTWNEYNSAQETLQTCNSMEEVHSLIDKRNTVRNTLYASAEEFISEVDKLPIENRMNVLKSLACSLDAAYGPYEVEHNSYEVLDQFFEWRNSKLQEFNNVKHRTDNSLRMLSEWFNKTMKFFDLNSSASLSSLEVVRGVDVMLDQAEHDIYKELEISTTQAGEADMKIIHSAFNKVMQKINEEQDFLLVVQNKYAASVQFKEQVGQWLNTYPNVGDLLSIKRSLKNLKAQLRWKLVEKNNLEDLGSYDEVTIHEMKEEIHRLRDNIYEEIGCEQKEYERLGNVVQNWFPELPLLHPEAAIKTYMQSAGLLTDSLERDLFDPEPMRELSSKRPLVCSEIKSQRILLKGYSVDIATEAKMIERAAKYHQAWSVLKEESGLLPILYLFACKSEPVAYVMVPFYPGWCLKTVQATKPLISEEVIKVMKGVAVGLQTLHNSNIVHGALHPHNVFAINRERGIVGDFDFTKTADQRNIVSWMVADKLDLVAPEVRSGQSAVPATDVFAYGCLLLWLNFPKNDFTVNPGGTPDLSELSMDPKLLSLVSRLISFNPNDRLRVDQMLKEDCFLEIKTADTIHEDANTSASNETIVASVFADETKSELLGEAAT